MIRCDDLRLNALLMISAFVSLSRLPDVCYISNMLTLYNFNMTFAFIAIKTRTPIKKKNSDR